MKRSRISMHVEMVDTQIITVHSKTIKDTVERESGPVLRLQDLFIAAGGQLSLDKLEKMFLIHTRRCVYVRVHLDHDSQKRT